MLTWLLQEVTKQIQTSANNQFLSGGLVLGIIGGAIAMLKGLPRKIWGYILKWSTLTLETTSSDKTAYTKIMYWLHTQKYTNKTRRVALRPLKGDVVFIPAKGVHYFIWNRRLVKLAWQDEDGKAGGGAEYGIFQTREKITLRIMGRNKKLLQKILDEANKLFTTDTSNKISVNLRNVVYDNDWLTEFRKPRGFDSILLPTDAKHLLQDCQHFLTDRAWYDRVGVPYRRGYLFYGPPGNGKSSAAFGLASELKLPLYVLNLANVMSDSGLEKAIFSLDVSKPSILLIEDIDTALPTRDLDKQKKPFSLGTLLNAMDGVVARENVILIVTTNNKETLDSALLRPGRIDQCIEFGNASEEQIRKAVNLFFPDGNNTAEQLLLPKQGSISMAAVQDVLLSLRYAA